MQHAVAAVALGLACFKHRQRQLQPAAAQAVAPAAARRAGMAAAAATADLDECCQRRRLASKCTAGSACRAARTAASCPCSSLTVPPSMAPAGAADGPGRMCRRSADTTAVSASGTPGTMLLPHAVRHEVQSSLGWLMPSDACSARSILHSVCHAGNYIDHKCPFTGNVSIRGRILSGKVRLRAGASPGAGSFARNSRLP